MAEGRRPQDVRNVLFDLDGTLIDTYEHILQSFRAATRQVLGRVVPDAELMCKVGQPLAVQMWDFARDEAEHAALMEAYRVHNARTFDERVRVFPGTEALLRTLAKAGVPCGVVTSKRHDSAVRALRRFALCDLVEFVIGADDCAEHKPAPGPVLAGCERLGAPPETCAYVGDSPFDIEAGKAAGCFTVGVTWGMFERAQLAAQAPDVLCASMPDLGRLLTA